MGVTIRKKTDYTYDELWVDIAGTICIIGYLASGGSIPINIFYTGIALVAGKEAVKRFRVA